MASDELQDQNDRTTGISEQSLEDGHKKSKGKFSLENFIDANKITIALGLIGVILVGFGVFFAKDDMFTSDSKIEILDGTSGSEGEDSEIVVEVGGAVEKPAVYKLKDGDRIEDALIAAGGISADADRTWMEKFVNRAAKLIDGQKLYILSTNEQSDVLSAKESGGYQSGSSGQGSGFQELVNINTATQKELESLWGIGPVTAKNIIEHRLYSSVEELLNQKIIKRNVYERNKDLLTVY